MNRHMIGGLSVAFDELSYINNYIVIYNGYEYDF